MLLSIPIEVLEFVVKRMRKDSDLLTVLFNNKWYHDPTIQYHAKRILEHCEEFSDILKEMGQ